MAELVDATDSKSVSARSAGSIPARGTKPSHEPAPIGRHDLPDMLPNRPQDIDAMRRDFRWDIPGDYNIARACVSVHAARYPDRPAIIDVTGPDPLVITFAELETQSARLAAGLSAAGLAFGDRIAVMLPQGAEAVILHMAAYRLGAIVVPLATQFGEQAIAHRIATSGARMLVAFPAAIDRALAAGVDQVACRMVVALGDHPESQPFADLFATKDLMVPVAGTGPETPAMMLFTSGTTGQPKGALHGHRVLPAHLPGIAMAQHMFGPPDDDARLWTPSDWAWAGGLLNALLPALAWGLPVIAARAARFDPVWAIDVMRRGGVTNLFMPATALRLLNGHLAGVAPTGLCLRVIGTAGEALGRETLEATASTFGVPVNEFYGQTECNAIIANCAALGVSRPGSMGVAVPGHDVAILDTDGNSAPTGQAGEVAVRTPDPVMFLGYWNDADATAQKFRNGWLMTGDRALRDGDGAFHFIGRGDDIITSSGYRIGPTEIEDCLIGHPAVEMAAVIGKPDPLRTEIVAAFVKLRQGFEPDDGLRRQIADHVRTHLSAHQYPREITFVDDIPLTESGKVIRRSFRTATSA